MSDIQDPGALALEAQLKRDAETFKAQRQEIAGFVHGKKDKQNKPGDDFARYMEQVTAATTSVRDAVANGFSDQATLEPSNRSITALAQARQDYQGYNRKYHEVDAIMKGGGGSIIPEHHLAPMPAILSKLAEDRSDNSLIDNERWAMQSVVHTLTETKALLTSAIEAHRQNKSGPITSDIAISAKAALHVLDIKLLPILETLQPKMVAFDEQYVDRHANHVYREFVDGVDASKGTEPRTYGTKTVIAATLGGLLAGGAAGYGVNELRHQFSDTVPNGRNVRTYDPEKERADFRAKLKADAEKADKAGKSGASPAP